jgi:uncharacterized protein with HEPN domain
VPRFLANRTLEQYLADDLCQSAVERQLEIAGDALGQLRKLDVKLFSRVPDGPLIVAFRNVLAHGYATLDHRRVYDAASDKVEGLMRVLQQMLSELPEDSRPPKKPRGNRCVKGYCGAVGNWDSELIRYPHSYPHSPTAGTERPEVA